MSAIRRDMAPANLVISSELTCLLKNSGLFNAAANALGLSPASCANSLSSASSGEKGKVPPFGWSSDSGRVWVFRGSTGRRERLYGLLGSQDRPRDQARTARRAER